MKINRLLLPLGKEVNYHEDINLNYYQGDKYHVKNIKSCHMDLNIVNYDSLITLHFDIKGEVLTTCSYTLEEFLYPYHIKQDIEINEDENDEFDIIDNNIDIDEMLITLIISHIPFKLVKPGAKLPSDGEGYRVLSEEDALKEKKKNPAFDILDELEFD